MSREDGKHDQNPSPPAAQMKVLGEIERVPAGEWIALSADESRVVAHSRALQEALALAGARGEQNPVLMKSDAAGQFIAV